MKIIVGISLHLCLKIVCFCFFYFKYDGVLCLILMVFYSEIAGAIGTRKGNSPIDNGLDMNEFTFIFTHVHNLSAWM